MSEVKYQSSILRSLERVNTLPTLREDYIPSITFRWFTTNDNKWNEWTWDEAYSFTTLNEIKHMFYKHIRDTNPSISKKWLPKFTFFGMTVDYDNDDNPSNESEIIPFGYSWYSSNDTKNEMTLMNPFYAVKRTNELFANKNGEYIINNLEEKGHRTIEEYYKDELKDEQFPTIFVYSLLDLFEIAAIDFPPSEKEWNGRFAQFFPYISSSQTVTL